MTHVEIGRIRELRATRPDAILEAAKNRRPRPLLGEDGRLLLIAADHPARGILAARGNPTAMANRDEFLSRLVTALKRPGVDGVMSTADVLEDLLLLGALEGKVTIASMNRGGVAGATFELDDRFTAYATAASVAAMGFDGGKVLVRVDPSDPGSVRTMEACGRAVGELADLGLTAFVEPFMSRRVGDKLTNDLSPEAVMRSIAIGGALGATSRHTWLKLPAVADMGRVMASTTLPTLLLGGDPTGPTADYYSTWRQALALPGVRGLLVGRALLFPPDGDVVAAVDNAVGMVHPDLIRQPA